MDIERCLDDKSRKAAYVRTMFDVLAPGYDAFTRWFSFGMDRKWKALLVAEAVERAARNSAVLDLACGTGDLGTALSRRLGARLALAFDISQSMLAEARGRLRRTGGHLTLAACDMLNLCLEDHSVDLVSIGYGLRNAADLRVALQEIARVLRPGGLLATLDFYQPTQKLWRELFLGYMWNAGRLAGWLWHREPITYGYIAPSIRRYVTIPEFERRLAAAGFDVEWRAAPLGGAIGIHVARRRHP